MRPSRDAPEQIGSYGACCFSLKKFKLCRINGPSHVLVFLPTGFFGQFLFKIKNKAQSGILTLQEVAKTDKSPLYLKKIIGGLQTSDQSNFFEKKPVKYTFTSIKFGALW